MNGKYSIVNQFGSVLQFLNEYQIYYCKLVFKCVTIHKWMTNIFVNLFWGVLQFLNESLIYSCKLVWRSHAITIWNRHYTGGLHAHRKHEQVSVTVL